MMRTEDVGPFPLPLTPAQRVAVDMAKVHALVAGLSFTEVTHRAPDAATYTYALHVAGPSVHPEPIS